MIIHEDIISFLKKGSFENINFGITRAELIEIIGEPDFTLPEKSRMPTLFEYDNIEFYFEDESENARLNFIQIDYPVKYSRKGKLVFNSHHWTVKLTIEQASDFLNNHKIRFEEKPYPSNLDFWRLLETESGVQIHFTNQVNENIWQLHSFSRLIELNSKKSLTKQISFEIEEIYYEQLRKQAEKNKKSIANQCKEIIKKHIENNTTNIL